MDIIAKSGREVQEDAFAIRRKVFMEEQGYRNEFDKFDDTCGYVALYANGKAVGTGRFFPSEADGKIAVFGRIAVLKEYRGQELGRKIMEELEKAAKKEGFCGAVLTAQEYAVPFYEKCGFSLSDDEILYDEGNPHRRMEKYF